MTIIQKSLLVITGLFTLSASAGNFSYDYVEAGFADYDVDDGLQFRGSFKFNDDMFFNATLASLDVIDVTKLGVGYIFPQSGTLDFYAGVGFTDYDTDDGLEITGGVRSQMSDKFELAGGINFFNGDNSDTQLFVTGVFKISNNFDLVAELQSGDVDVTYFSGRFNF